MNKPGMRIILIPIICVLLYGTIVMVHITSKDSGTDISDYYWKRIEKLEDDVDTLRQTNIKLSEKNKQLTLRLNNAKP